MHACVRAYVRTCVILYAQHGYVFGCVNLHTHEYLVLNYMYDELFCLIPIFTHGKAIKGKHDELCAN